MTGSADEQETGLTARFQTSIAGAKVTAMF
jgi:hypothetical protein